MSSYAILAITVLTISMRYAASLKVIAGDTIDFQCVTEKRDSVEYLPNFERKNEDSWTTLFVGSNPRPGTDLSKWLVSVDDASVFHYRLLKADLQDGGHYRCENVNILHHSLNVFSPVLDCGESQLPPNNFVDDVQAFRPVCRVETSGPMTIDDADARPSTLKWVVDGIEDESAFESKLTSNLTHVEATLTKDLTEEHHGKVISCVLDAGIVGESRREVQEKPRCVLGPLNISIDVRVKSISDNHDEDNCHNYDLILTGNPSPILQFVTVEDPTGIVESGISYEAESESSSDESTRTSGSESTNKRAISSKMAPSDMHSVGSDVEVRMRACDLESSVVAVVKYEGVEVTSVKFTSSEVVVESSAVDVKEGDSSEGVTIVVIVVVLLLVGAVVGVVYYLIMRRKQVASKIVEDVEAAERSGSEQEEVKEVKDEETGEEVKEGEESDEKKVEAGEDEKKVDEEVEVEEEKKGSKEEVKSVVEESDADAAALKAKLSVLEEAESDDALKAKLSALEDVEGVKMIDDSLNEGKEDSPLGDNVEV